MDLWRISKFSSLNGEGGRLYAARWHSTGHPIVYLAESPPGALIEMLVHLELTETTLPPTYTLLRVAVPDSLRIPSLELPPDERWKTDESLSRSLGDAWLRARSSALVRVPSVILPHTFNCLLNPLHPDAAQITIAETTSAIMDLRLIR